MSGQKPTGNSLQVLYLGFNIFLHSIGSIPRPEIAQKYCAVCQLLHRLFFAIY